MTYTPDVTLTARPTEAIPSINLRSPTQGELRDILDKFVPAHAQFGELTFLKALREALESAGLALTYSVRSAALQAKDGRCPPNIKPFRQPTNLPQPPGG